MALQNERSALEQEKVGLRDALLRVETDKLDAETERSGRSIALPGLINFIVVN